MIVIKNLIKQFEDNVVVNIPALSIYDGEIVGIVGNNGAGKTSLLRMMLDLVKPEKGFIQSGELDVSRSEKWKYYTSSYLDQNFLIDFLTPIEYFDFLSVVNEIEKLSLKKRIEEMKNFLSVELLETKKLIRNLSSGEKHKVGITGAFISSPKVLILDEPFNHLDPTSQIQLKSLLIGINKRESTTIIVSSHNLSHISDICTRVLLLVNGIVSIDGRNTSDTMKKIETHFKV